MCQVSTMNHVCPKYAKNLGVKAHEEIEKEVYGKQEEGEREGMVASSVLCVSSIVYYIYV